MDYSEAFTKMNDALERFVTEVKSKNSDIRATDKWTVKEVLCHIVFWHTNYAANYNALSHHQTPPLLDGPGYKLNDDGVDYFKRFSVEELVGTLRNAQESLRESIVIKKVPKMTYKQEGRVYKTEEFLHLIERHLSTHAGHVKKAKNR